MSFMRHGIQYLLPVAIVKSTSGQKHLRFLYVGAEIWFCDNEAEKALGTTNRYVCTYV